ncbi:MAG: fumarylacetoacetate hydrolase family protein, partial [Rhizobiales bacterium]|nr:fumarylacetoacetate hydrolase family protein [Hyphomicrobiales bacterium]
WLTQNGEVKQNGDIEQMIWNVPETINQLSQQVSLEAGDIIMTGTPAGVGQIKVGDTLACEVEGVGKLTVTVAPMEKEYARTA